MDPVIRAKLDEFHNQLDAHRRVSTQNSERMRLVIHNQKKHLESLIYTNKQTLEDLDKGRKRGFILLGVGLLVLGGLLYVNLSLSNRVGSMEKMLRKLELSSTAEMTRIKTQFQNLEQEQFETERVLDRTRKNLEAKP